MGKHHDHRYEKHHENAAHHGDGTGGHYGTNVGSYLPPPITHQPTHYPPKDQQPAANVNNIQVNVANQRAGQPQNIRSWKSGLCGCASDCSICCFTYFCFPCEICKLAIRLNECCCIGYAPGGIIAMRTKLRSIHGIKGSICGDVCAWMFCGFCAACQMDRELSTIGL